MASAGFVRYTGYDNADIFKNMLIEAYAAAKKNGLFFEGKIPMASTAEVSAAANYAAGDFSDVKSVKAGLQSWLSTQRIECDAGTMAEALTEELRRKRQEHLPRDILLADEVPCGTSAVVGADRRGEPARAVLPAYHEPCRGAYSVRFLRHGQGL